nr:MAG TPA: hypothetical protein [Caudoviricetes sp.]
MKAKFIPPSLISLSREYICFYRKVTVLVIYYEYGNKIY